MVIVCHIISQNPIIQGSIGFMGRIYLWKVTSLPSLVFIGNMLVEIWFLVWHVISQNHLTKRHSNNIVQSPLKVSHHSAKFGGHCHCGSGNIMVLVCHVISQNHVAKRCSNIMGKSPQRLVTILSSLVAMGTLVVEI